MNTKPTWIYVAGSRTRIMQGDPRAWRVYVNPDITEIPVVDVKIDGPVTTENFITGVNKDGDERGIFAWFRVYGTVTIRDQVAYITPLTPSAS